MRHPELGFCAVDLDNDSVVDEASLEATAATIIVVGNLE
jgi:hypothetical protein